jgi:predicted DNA-binding protein
MANMSRTDPQMSVRLPGDLKPRLVEAARQNGRTINAELVSRLEASFDRAPAPSLPVNAVRAIFEMREILGSLQEAMNAPKPPKPKVKLPVIGKKKDPASGQ